MKKMKKINFEKLRERNDYQIDRYLGGLNMEFIKHGNNWMIKNSNGRIVSNEEKLKLEKKELVIEDMESNKCQEKTTKRIKDINKELKKTIKKGKAIDITAEEKELKKINEAEDTDKASDESDTATITETI